LLVSLGAATAVYAIVFSYRWDYLGHFLAGAGLELLLLLLVAGGSRALAPHTTTTVLAVGGLAVISERLWFGDIFFDWIDVANTTFGALVVASALVAATAQDLPRRRWIPVGVALIGVGFVFRFVVVELVR